MELLHYYENQSTESPDVVFAQRLPPLVEQLVVTGENDTLDEKFIKQAEELLSHIISARTRQAVVNNFGKAGGASRTLRFILTFRSAIFTEHDPVTADFVKHLLAGQKNPAPGPIVTVLRFLNAEAQKVVVRAILNSERLGREDSERLARELIKEFWVCRSCQPAEWRAASLRQNTHESLGHHQGTHRPSRFAKRNHQAPSANSSTPSTTPTKSNKAGSSWPNPIRCRSSVYSACCLICPTARPILLRGLFRDVSSRLTHEKYATTYTKVVNALKNLHKVKADSPALLNFIALVRWVDPTSADKLVHDIGMAV